VNCENTNKVGPTQLLQIVPLFSLLFQRFGMLQVHENEISLRKWFGGTAHLRTLEGTLVLALLVVKQNFL